MLRTVFVAQKTPEILQAKLWNFSPNFHKNSLILDILITIDVDILGLNFSLIVELVKKEGNEEKFNILTLVVPILPYAIYR
jgi:hypothetical protein